MWGFPQRLWVGYSHIHPRFPTGGPVVIGVVLVSGLLTVYQIQPVIEAVQGAVSAENSASPGKEGMAPTGPRRWRLMGRTSGRFCSSALRLRRIFDHHPGLHRHDRQEFFWCVTYEN